MRYFKHIKQSHKSVLPIQASIREPSPARVRLKGTRFLNLSLTVHGYFLFYG